jgi:ribosomal protein S18 acetylase RimI-like enzyme
MRTLDGHASDRTQELTYGMAYWNAALPLVHDRTNFIRVGPGIGARALAGLTTEVEHEQSQAGLPHRKLVYDDDNGRKIAAMLRPLGWQVRNFVLMAYQGGEPPVPPPGHALAHVPAARVRETCIVHLRAGSGFREDAANQLLDQDERVAQSADVRWFAAYAGRDAVSVCSVWSDGRTAQIDAVSTLPDHRRRKHAAAVVKSALHAASPAHDLVFLVAEEHGWVPAWYERLGFQRVGDRFEALQVVGATRA